MDFTTAIGIGKALGGLFGKKKKGPSIAEQYQMQRDHHRLMPGITRDGYERAGFNPLLGVQGGASIPFQPSLIGDSHSTAGGIFAQGLDMVHDGLLQKTQLAQENEKLRETIDDLAKPSQPSHMDRYGDTIPLPSNGEMNVQGGISGDNGRYSGAGGGLPAGQLPDGAVSGNGSTAPIIDETREVLIDPITSGAGFTEISNNLTEFFGGPLVLPGSDGEPWGIDELATAVISVPANIGYRIGGAIADAQDAIRTRHKMSGIYRDVASAKKAKRRAASGWGNSPARSIAPTQREIDNHSFRRRALFGG